MIPTQIKWQEDALELVLRAKTFVHTTFSDFVRQAAVKEARAALGMEPKLPVFKQGSRVEQQPKRK
jgi:uncharacterized protein (DUF1778 family)